MLRAFFSPSLEIPHGHVLVRRPRAFEAAHAYRGASFGRARRVHGHNYVLTATIAGRIDPGAHFVAEIRALDALVGAVAGRMDHRRLDIEYEPLDGREPCVEALAIASFSELAIQAREALPSATVVASRVAESDDLWADHYGGETMELTRAYSFSAAHRLAGPGRGEDEERAVCGKCAHRHPHGHDYRFELTLAGRPDPATGLLADLGFLDETVRMRVLDPFDHRYLNEEVPPFDRVVPTAERIADRIWELLAADLPGLARVVIYETPRSAFTYRGP